ncbi:MAG: glycosyl transferase [Bacteroidetes bacterium]|nr:glycosyl transferase [Bacteroidota bacterium]
MPSVTLVIPTLDSSAFIQQTVRHYHSLLAEVDEIASVIIIDDHSTDDTYDLLLRERDALQSSIQIVQLRENCGQLISYQAGNSLATTDLIIHCDDDVLLTREDLLAYMDAYERSGNILLYGLIAGKNNHRKGRSTFLWLVKTFVFYRLRDKEFSSLCIYDRTVIEHVFRRAWGFRGNLFTPWIFHPHELGHVELNGGSQVLPHPSRYSLRGYVHHQKFLLLMLTRLLSLGLLVAIGVCLISGALRTNALTVSIAAVVFTIFLVSAFLLKVKSGLEFEIGRRS